MDTTVVWKKIEGELANSHAQGLNRAHHKIDGTVDKEILELVPSIHQLTTTTARSVLSNEAIALESLDRKEAAGAIRAAARITKKIGTLKLGIKKLLNNKVKNIAEGAKLDLAVRLRTEITVAKNSLNEIKQKSPAAFLALNSRELRVWRRQIERGRLVHTPVVHDQIAEVSQLLKRGQMVVLHGPTGSGKTELAKLAALDATGRSAVVVRGYSGMDSRELFGHMQLRASDIEKLSELPNKIEDAISTWKKLNSGASDEMVKNAESNITNRALRENSVTVSEYVLGSAYSALRDGRTLILDEANYIPPALLAKLNDIMTKRPGERINVQEDGIDPIAVAEGFSLVMTGNVNEGAQKKYSNRFEFDAALRDRVVMIKHGYLPQAESGRAIEHPVDNKQLFAIVLVSLLAPKLPIRDPNAPIQLRLEDRVGSMLLPGGSAMLEKLWNFCQFAAVTQRAFSGAVAHGDVFAFQRGGTSLGMPLDVALSPRRIINILSEWQGSGFEHPLEYYVKRRFVEQLLKDDQQEYVYQLASKFGLNLNSGSEVVGSIEVVSGRSVIEELFGLVPERSLWPDESPETKQAQDLTDAANMVAATLEQQKAIRAAEELLEQLKPFVESEN